MRITTWGRCAALGAAALCLTLAGTSTTTAQKEKKVQKNLPGLIGRIDLMTTSGVEQVKGEWRFHEVTTGVGPKKNELEPRAHGKFDDAKWDVLQPETLRKGRGPGKYSWCWYRIKVTIPDTVAGKPFEGGPVWFQTTVDDYGEIWVDGKIDLGRGRGAVSGFNTRNRVRLQKDEAKLNAKGKKVNVKRDARPGDVFQIAVLGINSPLGDPPANTYFLRPPTDLEFFAKDAPKGGADTPSIAGPPPGKKVAQINLMKKEGTELVKGEWRRHLITVHTGPKKNEIEPKAHGEFDDSKWEVIENPAQLSKAFGPGKFSMAWYRIKLTIPDKVDGKDVAGTAVWFRATVDDYAEVWVNGKIDRAFGTSGRGAISGFNKPNEVKLTDNARPGETIQIAVLGINGPFGNPPGNFIFFHSPVTLTFYAQGESAKKKE
jgi:hypothetical protein